MALPIKSLAILSLLGISGSFLVSNLDLVFYEGPSSIRSKLIRDGFKLLSHDSKDWEILWKKHEAESGGKLPFLVNSLDSFQVACEEVLKFTDLNSHYSQASRWCVVPQGFEDRLKFLGNRRIKEGEAIWTDLLAKYEKDDKNNFVTDLKSKETSELKIQEMKKYCDEVEKKGLKTYDKDFSEQFSRFLMWCTRKDS
ncbi:hypothetical protein MHF_0449 [Mycoplasma haemofelis Ohio2]|uniref:Uncharacterized protein n=1 Tax=Mycoplasma haemofelis (strain Ohio2) TaxID=859194 RepID=F6FHI6_MYCHI|nr:hypothetical protein MHF_0449 [Mycoplasma haemofelis Ohio2]